MSYVQDRYGIMVPTLSFGQNINPNFHDKEDDTLRIYTTKNNEPMVYSEVKQCIKMYETVFGKPAKTIYIPSTLETHKTEIERSFKLKVEVVIGMRHNGIHLTQI